MVSTACGVGNQITPVLSWKGGLGSLLGPIPRPVNVIGYLSVGGGELIDSL